MVFGEILMKTLKLALSTLILLVMSAVSFASANDIVACNVTLATNIQLGQSINIGGPTLEKCQQLGGVFVDFVAPTGSCHDAFYNGDLLLKVGGSTGVNKIACSAIAKCKIALPDPELCSGVQ